MSIYVDTSALLKRYLDEPDSGAVVAQLERDPVWITARVTYVEARRSLAARLQGDELVLARSHLEHDWGTVHIIEIDAELCVAAAAMAEEQGVRSLDALHLAACDRVRHDGLALLTADRRQADAARVLGMHLLQP